MKHIKLFESHSIVREISKHDAVVYQFDRDNIIPVNMSEIERVKNFIDPYCDRLHIENTLELISYTEAVNEYDPFTDKSISRQISFMRFTISYRFSMQVQVLKRPDEYWFIIDPVDEYNIEKQSESTKHYMADGDDGLLEFFKAFSEKKIFRKYGRD